MAEQKRCFSVKVTWPRGAGCDVKTIIVRPGDNLEDTPESVCAWVKANIHHRKGLDKYYYPATAEVDYEVNPDALPESSLKTGRPPEPLTAKPEPIGAT